MQFRGPKMGVQRTSSPMTRLLSVDGAAEYLGMSAWALRHRLSEGLLPIVRIGNRVFLDRQDLDDFIERSKVSYGWPERRAQ